MNETVIKRDGRSIVVTIPIGKGTLVFTFSEYVATGRRLDCHVLAEIRDATDKWCGGASIVADVRSGQSRDQMVKFLKESDISIRVKWLTLVSEACAAFEAEWKKGAAASVVRASQMTFEPTRFLVDQFLEMGSANLFHGDGGVGKTYVTMGISSCVVKGTDFLGKRTHDRGPVMFVDYENSARDWHERLTKIGMGGYEDDFHYKDAEGVPLADIAPELAGYVRDHGIKLVVIDSYAQACGGKPEDAEIATRYFAAVRKFGVTTLTIAHEAKNGGGTTPFGSVFVRNLARNVHSVKLAEGGIQSENIRTVTLSHLKFNNGPLQKDISYEMANVGGTMAFRIVVTQDKKSLSERIVDILRRDGGRSKASLTTELLANGESVRKALERLQENKAIILDRKDKTWSLIQRKTYE